MAISYPLTLPSTPGFNGARFRAVNVVAVSSSVFTLQHQVQEHMGNMWGIQLSLPPMKRPAAEEWLATLISLNGMLGTFLVGDPLGGTARGSLDIATTLEVAGGSQTGKVLSTKGWTASAIDVLLRGDYIQLGAGALTRLYKVMKDVTAESDGTADIDIWPRLRESPLNDDDITTANCKGTFRLSSNEFPWDMNVAQFYGMGFNAIEAI